MGLLVAVISHPSRLRNACFFITSTLLCAALPLITHAWIARHFPVWVITLNFHSWKDLLLSVKRVKNRECCTTWENNQQSVYKWIFWWLQIQQRILNLTNKSWDLLSQKPFPCYVLILLLNLTFSIIKSVISTQITSCMALDIAAMSIPFLKRWSSLITWI
mgnify:FL=1